MYTMDDAVATMLVDVNFPWGATYLDIMHYLECDHSATMSDSTLVGFALAWSASGRGVVQLCATCGAVALQLCGCSAEEKAAGATYVNLSAAARADRVAYERCCGRTVSANPPRGVWVNTLRPGYYLSQPRIPSRFMAHVRCLDVCNDQARFICPFCSFLCTQSGRVYRRRRSVVHTCEARGLVCGAYVVQAPPCVAPYAALECFVLHATRKTVFLPGQSAALSVDN